MAEIIWTKKARTDLRFIFEYIARDSPFYAERFILKLVELVDTLEQHPFSGRMVPEKEDPAIRELIEGNYRIFYKLSRSRIYILRVHHAARMIR